MQPHSGTGFLRMAMLATSAGLGLMLASLASVENVDGAFRFGWNGWVAVAFVVGAGLGVAYWRAALRLGLDDAKSPVARKRMRNFRLACVVLGVAAVFAFLYPVKFVRPEKRDEVRSGLVMVPVIVIPVMSLWYLVKRHIDADAAENKAAEERESDGTDRE